MEQYFSCLLSRARHFTRDEADARDLVQDTYVHALEKLPLADVEPGNVRAWLLAVMRNHWFNVVRHRRVRSKAALAFTMEDASDSSLCETRASGAQFLRAWQSLHEEARTIAQQCLLEGEPYELVSQRLGITPATVATSIHRTRKRLKATMFGCRSQFEPSNRAA
jgi:RNA polymerase sigma-70 factor (ECF subfamily)